MSTISLITIIGYFVLLITVGKLFQNFNKDEEDFLSAGRRTSWWLVGMSAFMANFSAWTFTGAAGAVYLSGWSVMWLFSANIIGYAIAAIWLAPWGRNSRVTAFGELVALRFTERTGIFYTWVGLPTAPLNAAATLLAVSVFMSVLTDFSVPVIIFVVGSVILFYSMTGGLWAAMATDFVQSMILMPFTILVAGVCLYHAGGFGNMLAEIQTQGLQEDFSFIKPNGYTPDNKYTWFWGIASFVAIVKGFISLGHIMKYRVVKETKDASKAAWLASGLFLLGSLVWFIPPAFARLYLSADVEALTLPNVHEGAYAVAAMKLLPAALEGILLIAILSATMSALDGGISGFGANIVKVIYPGLCKLFKAKPVTDGKKLLLFSRITSFVYGVLIMIVALIYYSRGASVFNILFDLLAYFAFLGVPFIWALFVKKVPSWSVYLTIGLGVIPSALGIFSAELFGEAWNYQTKITVNIVSGSIIFLSTRFFWFTAPQSYRDHVDRFFKLINTPVDLEKEIGSVVESDVSQLRLIGGCVLSVGIFVMLLTFFSKSAYDLIIMLIFSSSITLIGAVMAWIGYQSHLRVRAANALAKAKYETKGKKSGYLGNHLIFSEPVDEEIDTVTEHKKSSNESKENND